jgi:hypothetical protein
MPTTPPGSGELVVKASVAELIVRLKTFVTKTPRASVTLTVKESFSFGSVLQETVSSDPEGS